MVIATALSVVLFICCGYVAMLCLSRNLNDSTMSVTSYLAHFSFLLVAAFLISFIPISAFASSSEDVIGQVLCVVYLQMTGLAGKTVGCIAVVFTSLGALFGKTSWSLVLLMVVAIACALGSQSIVNTIASGVGGGVSMNDWC